MIDELVSPDYVGHDSAEPEPIQGPAGVRARFEKYLIAFPGGAITIDEQIVDGETVATRWTGRGTHTRRDRHHRPDRQGRNGLRG